MARGEGDGVVIPEEFFDDDSQELFTIEMCPRKYGAASDVKIENMRRLIPALRENLKEFTDLNGVLTILEKTIALIRDEAKTPMKVFTLSKLIDEKGSGLHI